MKDRLLTLDNLYEYYSTHKKSCHFNAMEEGRAIVVQTPATLKFKKEEITEGLTAVCLQACHTDRNLNGSSISKEVMEKKFLPTFKNRPILGYIHSVEGQDEFFDHRSHLEDDEIVYDESPVGIIPESNNARLEYDEEANHYNVFVDGYIFNDYTSAKEIIEREGECAVSVELSLKSFSYDAKDKTLVIEDGYFSGVTVLGRTPDGDIVKPGMAGSNVKLKDFSVENNSMFSAVEETELVKTLNKLNDTLSKINIKADAENFSEEGGTEVENEIILNEEVTTEETEVFEETVEEIVEETPVVETESVEEVTEETTTEETVTTEEEFSEDTTEVTPEEVVEDQAAQFEEELVHEDNKCKDDEDKENCSDEVKEENKCKKDNEVEEDEEVHDENKCKKNNEAEVKYSICVNGKTMEYSLSMNAKIEALSILVNDTYSEMDNTFYSIEAYEDHVIMVDYWTGRAFKQNYKCKKDTYSLVGDRVSVYAQYLTQDEINALENMKANYSSIETELSAYKEAEAYADKLTVFEDATYSQFLDSDEFKALMSKEVVDANTKEQLHDKAEIAFAKLVRANGSFELKEPEVVVEKKPSMFAFAKVETSTSFLDGLLNKKN